MGRKIPGKKHRTIKDPKKQRQARVDRVKNKVNNPPSNADEQEIPKSLLKIMELKAKSKQVFKKSKKRGRKKKKTLLNVARFLDKYPNTKTHEYIPNLVQKSNETQKSFLNRMHYMTQGLIDEAKLEKKFEIKIEKDQNTGEVIELRKLKAKKTSKKKKLNEKRKEKILKKKEDLSNFKDFDKQKDTVTFGEVVHRPPNLITPKLSKSNENIKKSKFSDLLLHKVAKNNQSKVINKCSRKSVFDKVKAENERQFIVEAYRKAKGKKEHI